LRPTFEHSLPQAGARAAGALRALVAATRDPAQAQRGKPVAIRAELKAVTP
jgi:hypothetical protein